MNDGSMPIEVVYCYTTADEDLSSSLDKHLSSLRREGPIVIWN